MKMKRAGRCLAAMVGAMAAALLIAVLPASAAPARTVAIDAALIEGSGVNVVLSASQLPASDDGQIYLYSNEVYEDGPVGALVGKAALSDKMAVSFPLGLNTPGSQLSRKFLAAVKQGGKMVQVSNEHYITNPEAAATWAAPRRDGSKKGILPDPTLIENGELEDLGVHQITYNIYLGDIVGETTDPAFPTTVFDYDGTRYSFNTAVLRGYDDLIRRYTMLGFQITLNLLNNRTAAGADLIHPLSRDAHVCPGYAFNTAEAGGTKHLKAIAAFLGMRYNGSGTYGQVDNWIIGNEVNARTEWYYMNTDNLDTNVNSYQKAFRIFYNGIRSVNGSAMIYNSIDQEWGRKSNPGCFLSKEFLDLFNAYVLREGNIDWGLSFHPYDSPLYDPYAWNGYTVWVHTDLATPYITMQNLFVLTDYMHSSQFLNPYGQVRSISLSEIGFTSHYGEDLQAASLAYGYLQALANPDVDAFMYYRHTDSAHEMESKIAQGLDRLDGSHKMAYDFYKNIDGPNAAAYKAQASQIMGMDIDATIGLRTPITRAGKGWW